MIEDFDYIESDSEVNKLPVFTKLKELVSIGSF